MLFADKLKKAREAAGLSRRELAQKIGASVVVILYWETGQREPSGKYLLKLMEALRLEKNDFIVDGEA